jgi:hypothetical protein
MPAAILRFVVNEVNYISPRLRAVFFGVWLRRPADPALVVAFMQATSAKDDPGKSKFEIEARAKGILVDAVKI